MSKFDLKEVYRNLGIRSKLLLGYVAVFFTLLLLACFVFYPVIRRTVESNIENNLNRSTKAMLDIVQTTATASIKNYLRAVAEKNRDIVVDSYRMYRQGKLTEEAAKQRAESILLSQHVGKTGYIYCLDSKGILRIHPVAQLVGVDLAQHQFIQEQLNKKEGYLEYDWKNPGESADRPKALYMTYFEPWDWIISASSYREEFRELVNIDNFRDSIRSLRFGQTGYAYILDSKGNIISHPFLTGNWYEVTAQDGQQFIKEMCTRKNGRIVYTWRNPDEKAFRKKLAVFNYLPEFDWLVVASSYEEEFYEPLRYLRHIFLFVFFISLIVLFALTIGYASYIVNSLDRLIRGFASGSAGDFSVRLPGTSRDEFGRLTDGFNNFMARLEDYHRSLREEVAHRKEAEDELREINERYRSILRAATEFAIIGTDTEDNIQFFNEGAELMLGYRSGEVEGKAKAALFHDPGEVAARMKELGMSADLGPVPAARQGGSETREWTYVRKDGSRFPVQLTVTARRDAQGHIVGFLGIGVDITERKRAEQALRESEALFSKAFHSSPVSIAIIDIATWRFVDVNERWVGLIGHAREDIIGHTAKELGIWASWDVRQHFIAELLQKGSEKDASVQMVTKAGEVREMLLSAELVSLGGRDVALFSAADVTERKRAQEELKRSHDELESRVRERTAQLADSNQKLEQEILERKDAEESLRKAYNELKILQSQLLQSAKMASVGQLAAGVAHEINNPTAFVVSNMEILSERFVVLVRVLELCTAAAECMAREDIKGARDFFLQVDRIRQEENMDLLMDDLPDLLAESMEGVKRIQEIVADLRTFSHFDEGVLQKADLNSLIEAAFNLANNELKYKVQVVKEYAVLPSIQCYAQRLGQVFLNLLVNAAQAIEREGTVKIKTYAQGEYVYAEIADNGCGMSEEVQKHLFEPFFTTKPVGQGTGLGLSLAYNIVEQHNGSITVISKVGEGTTFIIKLPLRPPAHERKN